MPIQEKRESHSLLLSQNEERVLIQKAQSGNQEARDRLVKVHQRLIRKLAKRYPGGEVDDYFQQGVVGFLEALNKFNLSYEKSLWTYAIRWVKYRMNQHCAKVLGLSEKARKARRSVLEKTEQLRRNNEQDPTPIEVAKACGVDLDTVHRILFGVRKVHITEDISEKGGGVMLPSSELGPESQVINRQAINLTFESFDDPDMSIKFLVLLQLHEAAEYTWAEIVELLTDPSSDMIHEWPSIHAICGQYSVILPCRWTKIQRLFQYPTPPNPLLTAEALRTWYSRSHTILKEQ